MQKEALAHLHDIARICGVKRKLTGRAVDLDMMHFVFSVLYLAYFRAGMNAVATAK